MAKAATTTQQLTLYCIHLHSPSFTHSPHSPFTMDETDENLTERLVCETPKALRSGVSTIGQQAGGATVSGFGTFPRSTGTQFSPARTTPTESCRDTSLELDTSDELVGDVVGDDGFNGEGSLFPVVLPANASPILAAPLAPACNPSSTTDGSNDHSQNNCPNPWLSRVGIAASVMAVWLSGAGRHLLSNLGVACNAIAIMLVHTKIEEMDEKINKRLDTQTEQLDQILSHLEFLTRKNQQGN
jgi:hypothetical protein